MREQFGRVRSAFGRLIGAHRALFQAEVGAIVEEIKVIALVAGVILGLALLLAGLLYTGTWLFLGEWLFGSIGWGLLHGTLVTLGIIAALAVYLLADSMRGPMLGLVAAIVFGIVLSLFLASNVLRGTSVWLGDQAAAALRLDAAALSGLHITFVAMAVVLGVLGFLVGVRAGIIAGILGLTAGLILGALFGFALGGDDLGRAYPILAEAAAWAILLGVIGLLLGAWKGGAGGAYAGLVGGALVGVVVGSLAGAITYDPKGAVAIGLTVAAIAWPIAAFVIAWQAGLDPGKRFGRLVPRQSMAAVNETRTWLGEEWQRQRSKLTSR